jgi:hypothetical protein
MKEKDVIYETPQVIVIEVDIEKGFASSIEELTEEEWN